jgi:hypothetical protein
MAQQILAADPPPKAANRIEAIPNPPQPLRGSSALRAEFR